MSEPVSPVVPPGPDPTAPDLLAEVLAALKSLDYTSPLWWASILTAVVSELVSLLTLFHAGNLAAHLSAVTQGEIVMSGQFLAVAAPLVIGWFHHKAKLALLVAAGQIHYNATVGYTNRYTAALEHPEPTLLTINAGATGNLGGSGAGGNG